MLSTGPRVYRDDLIRAVKRCLLSVFLALGLPGARDLTMVKEEGSCSHRVYILIAGDRHQTIAKSHRRKSRSW